LAHNLAPAQRNDVTSEVNFQRCDLVSRSRYPTIGLQTNCSGGGGTSGAGQFRQIDGRNVPVALYVAGEVDEMNGREYHPTDHFSSSIPLEGQFLQEVYARMGQQSAQR